MFDWDDEGLPDWLPDDDDEFGFDFDEEDSTSSSKPDSAPEPGDTGLSWLDDDTASTDAEDALDWLEDDSLGEFEEADDLSTELPWLTGDDSEDIAVGEEPPAQADPAPAATGVPWLTAEEIGEEAAAASVPDFDAADVPWTTADEDVVPSTIAYDEAADLPWVTGFDAPKSAEPEFAEAAAVEDEEEAEVGFAAGEDSTPSWLELEEEPVAPVEESFELDFDDEELDFDFDVESAPAESIFEDVDLGEGSAFEDTPRFEYDSPVDDQLDLEEFDFEALDDELGIDESWDEVPEQSAPEDELASALPDWFEEVDEPEEGQPAPTESAEPQFMPGWFMGFDEEDEEEVPEWLRDADLTDTGDLVGDTGNLERMFAEEDEAVEAPSPGTIEDTEIPDWFKEADESDTGDLDFDAMFVAAEPEPGPQAPVEAEETGLPMPDWASDFDALAEPTSPPVEVLPEPDWMSEFASPAPPPEIQADEGVLPRPDWASDFDTLAESPASEGPAGADWMDEFASPAPPPAAEADEDGLSVPDWASDFSMSPSSAEVPESDWASEFATPSGETGSGMPEPDWMGDFGAPAEVEEEQEPLPSWMDIAGAGILGDETESPTEPEPSAPAAADDGMPDWMRMDGIETFDAAFGPETPDAVVEDEGPDDLEAETGLAPGELPGWLLAAQQEQSERLREWGITEPQGPVPSAPSWIELVNPFRLSLGLDPRELARQENAGPLQGLRATLLAEPAISTASGKPGLVTGLVTTEEDERQSRALARMTAAFIREMEEAAEFVPEVGSVDTGDFDFEDEEADVEPVDEVEAKRARVATRRPLPVGRVLFSFLMIAVVIAPFFLPVDLIPAAPGDVPVAVSDVSALVDRLNPGELVLVAFEYGGAAVPELDPAAVAVLEHITSQGGRIVTLSTNPVGTMIGHRVVARVTEGANTRPVDLGYLAGFLGGLRDLVARDADPSAPPSARFTVDYQGDPTDLNVRSMRERFKLIVVLSSDHDALRAWLEQVNAVTGRVDGPLGSPVPMVALVSAGIEPVAAAYADSGQLKGYLAGYAGTVAYTQARNVAASTVFLKADAHSNSIVVATIFAVVIILLGSLGNMFRALLRRRRV